MTAPNTARPPQALPRRGLHRHGGIADLGQRHGLVAVETPQAGHAHLGVPARALVAKAASAEHGDAVALADIMFGPVVQHLPFVEDRRQIVQRLRARQRILCECQAGRLFVDMVDRKLLGHHGGPNVAAFAPGVVPGGVGFFQAVEIGCHGAGSLKERMVTQGEIWGKGGVASGGSSSSGKPERSEGRDPGIHAMTAAVRREGAEGRMARVAN